MFRLLIIGIVSAAFARPLPAQADSQPEHTPPLIPAAEIARHIGVLTHDSMLGRAISSRGLEMTARYIATEFEALGLTPRPPLYIEPDKPQAEKTLLERYPVRPWPDAARSRVIFSAGGQQAVASLATDAYLAWPVDFQHRMPMGVVVVAGRHTASSVRSSLPDQHKVIVYVPPDAVEPGSEHGVLLQLKRLQKSVVVLSALDSATFARRVRLAGKHLRFESGSDEASWRVYLRPTMVAGVNELLTNNGVDLSRLHADTMPVVHELSELQVSLDLHMNRGTDGQTAPNVVGVLEGSDPKLRDQYVVFSTYMDDGGLGRAADGFRHGDDDNTAGLALFLALAKAFAQAETPPKRSILFLVTSGSAIGYQGSTAFVTKLRAQQNMISFIGGGMDSASAVKYRWRPTNVVINITVDRLGEMRGDSIIVDGMEDVALIASPSSVAMMYPELKLSVVDGGSVTTRWGADHFTFVQNGIPSLLFRAGARDDDAPADASVSATDAGRLARVVRLLFYTGQAAASAIQVPAWTREGRIRFLENVME